MPEYHQVVIRGHGVWNWRQVGRIVVYSKEFSEYPEAMSEGLLTCSDLKDEHYSIVSLSFSLTDDHKRILVEIHTGPLTSE